MPPWTLEYTDDIDGRVTRNGHRVLFGASPSVSSLEVVHRPRPRLIVHWVNDDNPTDPELLRIHARYGVVERQAFDWVRQPLTTRPLVGFELLRPGPNQNGDSFSPEVRDQVIQQFLSNPEGRQRLAQSMMAPIRRNIDYQAFGRAAFLVDQLPEGALPTYSTAPSEMAPGVHIPDWIKPDQWVYHKTEDRYARITECGKLRVNLLEWHTETPVWHNILVIAREWGPCEKPKEPRPVWNRLLEDDFE